MAGAAARGPDAPGKGAGAGLRHSESSVFSAFGGDDEARFRAALAVPPGRRACAEASAVQEFLASLALLRGVPPAALAQWAQAVDYGRVQEEPGGDDSTRCAPRAAVRAAAAARGRPARRRAACDRRARRGRFFAAGEADVSTFYIVLAGRVALASPTATTEEQSQAPAAHKPALKRAHTAARLRDQPLRRSKTLGRPEATAASCPARAHVPEQVFAELGPGDSFGEEAIFALGEADREIAVATDTICALDYAARKYSAQRVTRDLEFLAVRDEEVLASLLQVRVVCMRRCRMLAECIRFQGAWRERESARDSALLRVLSRRGRNFDSTTWESCGCVRRCQRSRLIPSRLCALSASC